MCWSTRKTALAELLQLPVAVHFVRTTVVIQFEMKRMTIQEKKNYIKSSMTDYKYLNTRDEDVLKRSWKIKIRRRSSTTIHEEKECCKTYT